MGYFFETTGLEFETEIIDKISLFSLKEWGVGAFKMSTLAEDRFEGADCFVLGIPIDITLAYEQKKRMKRLNCQLIFDGITVEFGVRFGNSQVQFDTPVLVIGVGSSLGVNKGNMWYALDMIKTNLKQILDTGMDAYFEATTQGIRGECVTVFILEEHGRVLTDSSLQKLTREFFEKEGFEKAVVVCGLVAEKQIKEIATKNKYSNFLNEEWELIYMSDGNRPYKLGRMEKSRLCEQLMRGDDSSVLAVLKEILIYCYCK